MSERRQRLAVVAAVVLAVLALGGCGIVQAQTKTQNALHRAGFSDVSVSLHVQNDNTTVEVTGVGDGRGPEGQRAASVVWRSFPYRLDGVVIDGILYSKQVLFDRFGGRPEAYERRSLGNEFERIGKTVLGVGGVVLLVISAVLVLLIFLFVRRGRRINAVL